MSEKANDAKTEELTAAAFDPLAISKETKWYHPEVWVVKWGATMVLASFFVFRQVHGSAKRVALRLKDIEYGTFDAQRCVPTKYISGAEVYAVRERPHGEYTGLAPDVQIHFGLDGWKTARRWDGKSQVINTID